MSAALLALEPEKVGAGPLGLLVVVLMGIATVLLIRNMNTRIKGLPEQFPPPDAETAAPTDATASAAPRDSTASTASADSTASRASADTTASTDSPAPMASAQSPDSPGSADGPTPRDPDQKG